MNQMNKDTYIRILRRKLHGMSDEDIEDAISYVSEYFEEAGEGNESTVWRDLGSPSKFAATIKADSISRNAQDDGEEGNRHPRSSFSRMITICAGIISLPIALPLLLVILCLMFAFVCVIGAFGFAGFISLIICVPAGIISITRGVFVISDAMGNGLIAIGTGLLTIGIGIMLFTGFTQLVRWMTPYFSNSILRIYQRVRGDRAYEKE